MEICDSHGLAFERSQSGHGHWNMSHKGEGDYQLRQSEELPEGYQLRVSTPSKNGKKPKTATPKSYADVPFANLMTTETQDLRERVSQARLGRELQALEATGVGAQHEMTQLKTELSQVKQQLLDQESQRATERIEARFDRLESRLSAPAQTAPSAMERLLEPLLGSLLERGINPPASEGGFRLDLGDGQGMSLDVFDRLDQILGRRREQDAKSEFLTTAREMLPDFIEAGKRMAAATESHASSRGQSVFEESEPAIVRVSCPVCHIGLAVPVDDPDAACPACGAVFDSEGQVTGQGATHDEQELGGQAHGIQSSEILEVN